MSKSVFIPVSYRQYRQFIAGIDTRKIKGKGYDTAIYDTAGDIQAIVHAASIDEKGRCYPAEYYVRNNYQGHIQNSTPNAISSAVSLRSAQLAA